MGKKEYASHRYECIHWMVCGVCGKDFRRPEEQAKYQKTDMFSKIKSKLSKIEIFRLIPPSWWHQQRIIWPPYSSEFYSNQSLILLINDKLMIVILVHHERCKNELGYSCDQCGKAYNTNAALTKHRKRTHEGFRDYAYGHKRTGGKPKTSDQAAKRSKPSNAQQNSRIQSSSHSRRVQQAPQKAMQGIVPVMGTPEQQNSGQMIFEYQQNSIMAPLMGYSLGKGINFYQ